MFLNILPPRNIVHGGRGTPCIREGKSYVVRDFFLYCFFLYFIPAKSKSLDLAELYKSGFKGILSCNLGPILQDFCVLIKINLTKPIIWKNYLIFFSLNVKQNTEANISLECLESKRYNFVRMQKMPNKEQKKPPWMKQKWNLTKVQKLNSKHLIKSEIDFWRST